jgi:outer membrane protein
MFKKVIFFGCALALPFMQPLHADPLKLGFVDFKECLEKSKQGQKERESFENLKNQMQSKLKESETELQSIAKKLEDQDYMDGLSPAAEEELKMKFQSMSQQFAQFQNQYYQLLQQANMKLFQSLHQQVSSAADKIREKEHFSMILNEESVFASAPTFDCTEKVIAEMDRRFQLENSEAVLGQQP